MKIIKITSLLDFGGQESKLITFTNDKSILKNEYHFAAIGHGGFAQKTIEDRGFKVKIFNKNPSIKKLSNIWMLYKWLKFEKPDVVHTAAGEANFHGVIAAKLAGVKVIIAEEIGFPNHSNLAKFVFKHIYKLTSVVLCVSNAVKKFLIDTNEITPNKGVVMYNPVVSRGNFQRQLPNDFTICCVGRLEEVKNQKLLIEAFAAIDNKQAKLILVGDGRERQNLEHLAKRLTCFDRITFTGFEKVPEQYISKSSLFVLPSLTEGFGIAVVEAMLVGVPCLCSSVGGIPEFIEEGINGWLFDPNNKEELINKLNYLQKKSTQELEAVGRNGKESVISKFSLESYVIELENLYDTLVNKSK